ncbi:hypothetical protein FF38_10852 [Lucilia cuprina]|uniref:Uncharacterized protein n=1 Tax=Lucilia cuprina TaxID=7375 RepID=A0A0L0C3R7_LUCCU|nr:hypothetical protein FF38_10852 [Lucilia cuprina]
MCIICSKLRDVKRTNEKYIIQMQQIAELVQENRSNQLKFVLKKVVREVWGFLNQETRKATIKHFKPVLGNTGRGRMLFVCLDDVWACCVHWMRGVKLKFLKLIPGVGVDVDANADVVGGGGVLSFVVVVGGVVFVVVVVVECSLVCCVSVGSGGGFLAFVSGIGVGIGFGVVVKSIPHS